MGTNKNDLCECVRAHETNDTHKNLAAMAATAVAEYNGNNIIRTKVHSFIHFVQASFAYFLCTPRPNAMIYMNATHTSNTTHIHIGAGYASNSLSLSHTHKHTSKQPNIRRRQDSNAKLKVIIRIFFLDPENEQHIYLFKHLCMCGCASKRACSNCGRKEKPTKLSLPIRTNEKYYFGRK